MRRAQTHAHIDRIHLQGVQAFSQLALDLQSPYMSCLCVRVRSRPVYCRPSELLILWYSMSVSYYIGNRKTG